MARVEGAKKTHPESRKRQVSHLVIGEGHTQGVWRSTVTLHDDDGMTSIWDGVHNDNLEVDLTRFPDPDTERLVWHYTRPPALESILQNHVLWATDYRALNDRDELRIGARRLREAFKELQNEEAWLDPSEPRTDLGRLREALEDVAGAEHDGNAFVTSFSERGDSTDQWKSYAGAAGFAIGVPDGVRLPIVGTDSAGAGYGRYVEETPLRWVALNYGRKQQLAAAKRGLFEVLAEANNADHYRDVDDEIDVSSIFENRAASVYVDAVASAKNKGFKSERERRYVVARPRAASAIRSRKRPSKAGGTEVVEYVEITGAVEERFDRRWDRRDAPFYQAAPSVLPIRQVRMGPGNDPARTKAWLRDLLDLNGYNDVRIRKSKSTFR